MGTFPLKLKYDIKSSRWQWYISSVAKDAVVIHWALTSYVRSRDRVCLSICMCLQIDYVCIYLPLSNFDVSCEMYNLERSGIGLIYSISILCVFADTISQNR